MNTLTRVKIGLTLMALVFFALGMRTGLDWQRYMAIGLLAAAVGLRFVGRRR